MKKLCVVYFLFCVFLMGQEKGEVPYSTIKKFVQEAMDRIENRQNKETSQKTTTLKTISTDDNQSILQKWENFKKSEEKALFVIYNKQKKEDIDQQLQYLIDLGLFDEGLKQTKSKLNDSSLPWTQAGYGHYYMAFFHTMLGENKEAEECIKIANEYWNKYENTQWNQGGDSFFNIRKQKPPLELYKELEVQRQQYIDKYEQYHALKEKMKYPNFNWFDWFKLAKQANEIGIRNEEFAFLMICVLTANDNRQKAWTIGQIKKYFKETNQSHRTIE
ncbi:MAG: hypothetical protein KBC30_05935 [Planctomycetes bacterium]|nr:hypothetical protein [Planctomycetota bacterium]HON44198.1 hypothetical protein [Planctomycetota bacterium]HPY74122.1 hypothetical protein [Planctomycetota bacterium]HQA99668.1 hypothetical protein [Planctomycetota bacterium]HRU52191.1 hypothetical protein [Planctomycetota bacterium]